ncbi:MAG: HAD family phosphatase [Treponema sp.]|nr:HAD family phosphatase [Treponema sp.]
MLDFDINKMKCAIFDMDGTILESMPMWVHIGDIYLEEKKLPEDVSLWNAIKSMTLKEASEYIKEKNNISDSVEKIMKDIKDIIYRYYSTNLKLKEGAKELLLKLKEKNIPFVLATATDRTCVDACLKRLGIYELFTDILTCMELNTSKQSPFIFEEAARRCNVPLENAVVFEDAIHAITTVVNANIHVIALKDSVAVQDHDWEKICKITPNTFNSLNEVLSLL